MNSRTSSERTDSRCDLRGQVGYGLNYLIDIKHAVIVDVEATTPDGNFLLANSLVNAITLVRIEK